MLILVALVLAQSVPVKAGGDACALIANADVRRVLGVDVKQRQPVAPGERGLLSQCYFDTGTPRSISVAVMRARDARAAKDSGEGEQEPNARPVKGLGDEADWSGNRISGALYVRRGERLIRVSVGGIRDERERIDKSRALAAAALRRLRPH